MSILEVGTNLVRQAIDVAVARKGLDAEKAKGNAALKLIQSADVPPPKKVGSGQNGLGQLTDFYA